MGIFQVFFDESGKQSDHPVVTFAGVCAGESRLAAFDAEWNILLDKYGIGDLHMKKASDLNADLGPLMPPGQSFEERIEALKPFADCINEHLELGLIQAWDVKGFRAMDKKVKEGLGNTDDPYYLAFARAVAELVDYVGPDDPISLTCDEDEGTASTCYRHYLGLKEADDKIRDKVISLDFEDDCVVPALQAADLVAYLSRREARFMFYEQSYGLRPLFDYLTRKQPEGKMNWLAMFADENAVAGLT
jgi:Protein of unknown function (DUF3800)